MTLSNAERQARWRARRERELAAFREVRDSGQDAPADGKRYAALEAEVARLKARLAEQSLRNDVANEGTEPETAPGTEVDRLKAEIEALKGPASLRNALTEEGRHTLKAFEALITQADVLGWLGLTDAQCEAMNARLVDLCIEIESMADDAYEAFKEGRASEAPETKSLSAALMRGRKPLLTRDDDDEEIIDADDVRAHNRPRRRRGSRNRIPDLMRDDDDPPPDAAGQSLRNDATDEADAVANRPPAEPNAAPEALTGTALLAWTGNEECGAFYALTDDGMYLVTLPKNPMRGGLQGWWARFIKASMVTDTTLSLFELADRCGTLLDVSTTFAGIPVPVLFPTADEAMAQAQAHFANQREA